MATSIYGFAQSAVSSGSGVTEALRLYARAVAQGADETGSISNPDVIRSARQIYLEPYADDLRISTKMAESVNDENRLRDKINDVENATSVFKETVNETLRAYAKAYYQSPDDLISTTAYTMNLAVEELNDEIGRRRERGDSISDLVTLESEYARKADMLSRLTREVISGSVSNPNAYGWFIKTNPDDGSIVDIALDLVDSTQRKTGYFRSESMYGKVPVWLNTVQNNEGDEIARLGSNQFKLEKDDTRGDILKMSGKQWGRYLKSLFPGGESPAQASAASRQINIGNIRFGDALTLPKGSIAKDAGGRYYYWGSDGVYKSENLQNLQSFLKISGFGGTSDIDERAFPISRNEVDALGPFTSEDGKSRIIDESLLGGISSGSQSKAQFAPISQAAQEYFRNTPSPLSIHAQGGTTDPNRVSIGPEVPRKDPAVKDTTQVGRESTEDVIQQEGQKFTEAFAPLLQPFRNIFG